MATTSAGASGAGPPSRPVPTRSSRAATTRTSAGGARPHILATIWGAAARALAVWDFGSA